MSDTPTTVSRSALSFFSGTLLSRITGMVRDMTMAFFFGTSPALAAFFFAYRFVYLLRRLLGEGLLHQGFVPHFEATSAQDPKLGALFFRDLFGSLFLVLIGILLLLEMGLSLFLASDIGTEGGRFIAQLSRWMLPGIVFICLFGLTGGLLQARRRFFLPAVSGAVFNIVWIVGVVTLYFFQVENAVLLLAGILSIAFFFQWAITTPIVWKELRSSLSKWELFRPKIFSAQLKRLFAPLLLGMIGVASMQINSAVDVIFARFASPEGPAYLWYAIRLQQLPLALFGIALSSALLPSLSRAVARADSEKFNSLLSFSIKRCASLIFPCAIGIFVLGGASINLLFGRGDFGAISTHQTTLCLWGYGIGLLPAAFIQILAPGFYAQKDYNTPMWGFIASSLVNILLNGFFVFGLGFGAAAVALSTSLSTWLNALYLWRRLKRKGKAELLYFGKAASCSLLAGGITLFLGAAFLGDPTLKLCQGAPFLFPREFLGQLSLFAFQAALFFSVLLSFTRMLKIESPFDFLYSSR